jgi:hypothetical protein
MTGSLHFRKRRQESDGTAPRHAGYPHNGRRFRTASATAIALGLSAMLAITPAKAHARPSLADPATPVGVEPLGSTARAAQALVFSDEFTGTSRDTSKWTARDQERTESSRADGIRWWGGASTPRSATCRCAGRGRRG